MNENRQEYIWLGMVDGVVAIIVAKVRKVRQGPSGVRKISEDRNVGEIEHAI